MEGKIKILKRPEISEIAGEKIMVDFETGNYFMLKGTANDIWEILKDGITKAEICDYLLANYQVEREVCEESVEEFLQQMVKYKFILFE